MKSFENTRLFLFDMDGTLYLGNSLFDFTIELLNTIKEQQKTYVFMTNNSSRSVSDYVKKLKGFGLTSSEEEFVTSSQVTAQYLKQQFPDKKIYVAGTSSFFQELQKERLDVTTEYSDAINCIVSGFDTELTYKKLEDLCRLLTKDIPYIATNPDLVCPTEYGFVPDCGSVSQMIYNATGKKPVFIGKPSSLMPEYAMKKWNAAKEDTLVIGDRLYTDIACGINAGIPSLLVLSGETTPEMAGESEFKPDYTLQDCGDLLRILKSL